MSRNYDNSQGGEHVVDVLSSYIDDALSRRERESVRAHLETCDSCRIEHDGLIGMKAMLRSLPVVPPPRAFTLTPEMVGAGARRESFWQRLLTPRAVPRFATGSVVAFALLIFLLVGDFTGNNQSAIVAPYAQTSGAPASESARNSDVAVKAAPTTAIAASGPPFLPPDVADATATTGAVGAGQQPTELNGFDTANEPTPGTLSSALEPAASATVSAQDAFVESLRGRPMGRVEDDGIADSTAALPLLQIALAAIGTLLAIGALVARRRSV